VRKIPQNMGGPSLEVARIFMYMTVPIAFFYFVGMPSFRKEYVRPFKKEIFPDTVNVPPKTLEGSKALLEQLKADRQRQQSDASGAATGAGTSATTTASQ